MARLSCTPSSARLACAAALSIFFVSPPAMADQHTPSKAESKKAEKEADQVVAAFSQALDSAFEAEVEYIVGELRKNRDLTHCLSGMLKADAPSVA